MSRSTEYLLYRMSGVSREISERDSLLPKILIFMFFVVSHLKFLFNKIKSPDVSLKWLNSKV